MDTSFRHSTRRRYDALARLRTLTAGVAVTGIAATAAFGVAAASGFRGTSDQQVVSAGGVTNSSGSSNLPAATPAPFDQQGGTFQVPFFGSGIQAPSRSRGSGHVSTGGS
jgi:hypothetical protein